jgi:hypothetical protein
MTRSYALFAERVALLDAFPTDFNEGALDWPADQALERNVVVDRPGAAAGRERRAAVGA